MKFSIGDKILLKRTDEEGVVVSIISNEMFEVEVNGTHFPVHKDDIDHPYLKWFTEKKQIQKKAAPAEQLPVEKQKLRPQRLARGIYISFLPVFKTELFEDVVDHLKIYLINETPNTIDIKYEVKILHKTEFSYNGTLHSFADLYLHNLPYEDMNNVPRFHWALKDTHDERLKTEEGILKIRPQRLFEHIEQCLAKNEPTFHYLLVEDFIVKPKEEKPVRNPSPIEITRPRSAKSFSLDELPRYELDLHIEQLMGDPRNLSNAEIITIQLNTLQRYLSLAIMHRQQRMIIIHGVGKGKLREEVHKILKQIPEVKSYKNEWLANYGFGATEVLFRY